MQCIDATHFWFISRCQGPRELNKNTNTKTNIKSLRSPFFPVKFCIQMTQSTSSKQEIIVFVAKAYGLDPRHGDLIKCYDITDGNE